jgi:hypothetical protein
MDTAVVAAAIPLVTTLRVALIAHVDTSTVGVVRSATDGPVAVLGQTARA